MVTLIKSVKKKKHCFTFISTERHGGNLCYPSLLNFYDNEIIIKLVINFFQTKLFKIKEVG